MPDLSLNPFPLGKLAPTPGAPIRLTANFPSLYGNANNGKDLFAKQVVVTADVNNTGNVYLGSGDMNTTTLAGVLAVLVGGQSIAFTAYDQGNIHHVGDLFIDVAVGGEFALAYAYVM